ncbi:MAG: hypothetical protein NTW87_13465 [Planctomycetota bacterium]|nr:hypothetical protein [Planctomycetota bacterium]
MMHPIRKALRQLWTGLALIVAASIIGSCLGYVIIVLAVVISEGVKSSWGPIVTQVIFGVCFSVSLYVLAWLFLRRKANQSQARADGVAVPAKEPGTEDKKRAEGERRE